jgi:hypothetical protein
MKILNFAKNLAKNTLRGLTSAFSALMGMGVLVCGCFICLFITGYTSSLFGLLIASKQGNDCIVTGDYVVTGYCVFVVLALLCIISITIHGMCVKIKEIWQDS